MNNLRDKYPDILAHCALGHPPGWNLLVEQLLECITQYCANNNVTPISATQIKDKFGGLRFYYQGGDDMIDGMVWFAEHLSETICEDCGSTEGVVTTSPPGWVYTRCPKCMKIAKEV